jgi:hypothetical protein
MTHYAQFGINTVYPEKFFIGVVMRIMAGGAVYDAILIEEKFGRRSWVELGVWERTIIGKRNRMVLLERGSEK